MSGMSRAKKTVSASVPRSDSQSVSTQGDQDLPEDMRALVRDAVALLGNVLRDELGEKAYGRIERVRKKMAGIRRASEKETTRVLSQALDELGALGKTERLDFARAYTLMFETINACENAYRTHRLRQTPRTPLPEGAESIVYVLTAHPTEARAPASIAVFSHVQGLLVRALEIDFFSIASELRAWLGIAWRAPIVRYRSPKVQDEAEHIYSIVLRPENLDGLLDFGGGSDETAHVPLKLRSWVGGDKDGHPGVNEKTLRDSLQLSRDSIVRYAHGLLRDLKAATELAGDAELGRLAAEIDRGLNAVHSLRTDDGSRIAKFRASVVRFSRAYRAAFGGETRALGRLERLLLIFPGLVVPMELREDSAMLVSDPSGKSLAIGRMLSEVKRLAGKTDPRAYAQSMIISMTQEVRHIEIAAGMVKRLTGSLRIPIVPLFEQRDALESSVPILREMVKLPAIRESLRQYWNNHLEVMLGYSDSSKESGVLASRLLVTKAMGEIDRLAATAKFKPVFFHGSGGSIDRGGGSVSEQMAAWPTTARRNYKATIQGEMVERTFASPEISRSRLEQILKAAGAAPQSAPESSPELRYFAEVTAGHYRETISSPRFLRMVERATPYRFLSALKIGSRPAKRGGSLSVPSLRAIPWVLCWTQTRVLFQTWWGVGYAWEKLDRKGKDALRGEAKRNPLFSTYVRALGFTLAKVELPIWELYLAHAGLPAEEVAFFRNEFRNELESARRFLREVSGEKDPLWFRPWLARSIELRASLIHPLNALQILAQRDHDLPLLRLTVTGIASGMLTTG